MINITSSFKGLLFVSTAAIAIGVAHPAAADTDSCAKQTTIVKCSKEDALRNISRHTEDASSKKPAEKQLSRETRWNASEYAGDEVIATKSPDAASTGSGNYGDDVVVATSPDTDPTVSKLRADVRALVHSVAVSGKPRTIQDRVSNALDIENDDALLMELENIVTTFRVRDRSGYQDFYAQLVTLVDLYRKQIVDTTTVSTTRNFVSDTSHFVPASDRHNRDRDRSTEHDSAKAASSGSESNSGNESATN